SSAPLTHSFATRRSSDLGAVTAPTLTFVTGDPNNLQVGEVVLLSASGMELREGAIFSGTLRGDPVQLVTLANGNLTFVLPNVYRSEERRVGKECRAGWTR